MSNSINKQLEYSDEPQSLIETVDAPNHSAQFGTKRQVRGAAVAGGLAGFALIGPAAGLVAAGGAALATSGKGDIGRVARATGDSVSDLGRSLKKFDRKHSVTERTSKGIVKGCNWVSKRLSQGTEKRKSIKNIM